MARGTSQLIPTLLKKIPDRARLLIAVSGGVDSMVLLHACLAIVRQRKLHIEIAHVDHQLRKESKADAHFVKSFAKEQKIPCHLKVATPPRRKAGQGTKNIEAWGRETRYSFFEAVRAKRTLQYVLTAHNANDLVETFLMRLVNNKEPHLIFSVDTDRHLLRPLLEVTRQEIEQYAASHSISWREDTSNRDESFLRNRIRHTLIPLLAKEFDPRIVEVLAMRAEGISEDAALLYAMADEAIAGSKGAMTSQRWLTQAKKQIGSLPKQIQWRATEQLMFTELGFRIGRKKGAELASVICGNTAACQLPSGVVIRRSKGKLAIS